jgi:putative flippase GtrA
MKPRAVIRRAGVVRSSTVAQLVRYGIVGMVTAGTYSSIYLGLVSVAFPGGRAVLAVPFAFAITLIVGFLLHSKWSFAGHGSRTGGAQYARFATVHGSGFGVSLALTWLLTGWLGAPVWTPLIPSVTLIPLVSFVVQRRWVFA